MKVRVLIVDDSQVVRHMLSKQLAHDPDIEVVGTAPDPYVARELIVRLKPDVLTLDIEMPKMDGLTFLEKLMKHHPLPVIILSSVASHGSDNALKALRLGAVDVFSKPKSAHGVGQISGLLSRQIKAAAGARIDYLRPLEMKPNREKQLPQQFPNDRLITIGASTGGTRAIETVLRDFPAEAPATVIVQHMPPGFTRSFAESLDRVCAMSVTEARNGDTLTPGRAFVAPGASHLLVQSFGTNHRLKLTDGPRVHYQKPAVDVTFKSVAEELGHLAVGAVLTGMGADGAEGLLAMRKQGARTIAQDQETCVVFGMPKEAIKRGGAEQVLPLPDIARGLLGFASATGQAA